VVRWIIHVCDNVSAMTDDSSLWY